MVNLQEIQTGNMCLSPNMFSLPLSIGPFQSHPRRDSNTRCFCAFPLEPVSWDQVLPFPLKLRSLKWWPNRFHFSHTLRQSSTSSQVHGFALGKARTTRSGCCSGTPPTAASCTERSAPANCRAWAGPCAPKRRRDGTPGRWAEEGVGQNQQPSIC